MGAERLSEYVRRYGFGRPVSPDFPGENPGIVWDRDKWTESALMSVSMGYQVGVTPLQMASAVSAVANGGLLVEPRVIRAIYRDNRRYVVQPKIVRRTTSADTAALLTGIMEGVVEEGTAKAAQIPGYTIAGKTGTASKLFNGHYSHGDLTKALDQLPSDLDEYTDCRAVIRSAQLGSAGGTHGGKPDGIVGKVNAGAHVLLPAQAWGD